MVLGILILALTAGAFLHFIIDGIIAPSAQMSTRIELFTRAEELELIARKNARSFDSKIHEVMRTAVHNLISGMSRYTVVSVGGFVRRYQHDLEFR